MDPDFWPDIATTQLLCHCNSNLLCYLLFEPHLTTSFQGNKFRLKRTLMRMAPQVSLVSYDELVLPFTLLTFTKLDIENGPELRGKTERSVLHPLCSLHTSVSVQKGEPYRF